MKGHISQDTVVAAPAAAMWDAYRGLSLGRLVDKLLPDVIGRVEVLQGDGGVGTLVKLTFPPGTPGGGYMVEKFIRSDDEARVKETETIEGGFRALGFDLYRVRLEVLEKDCVSSVVKSSIEYELDDKISDLASEVSTKPLEIMAETIGKHVGEKITAQ